MNNLPYFRNKFQSIGTYTISIQLIKITTDKNLCGRVREISFNPGKVLKMKLPIILVHESICKLILWMVKLE